MADYLRVHGLARVAGINYVNARTVVNPAFFGTGRQNYPNMQSEDLAANIAGTRGFVRACFAQQPDADDFEIMLAFNMVVPPKVRAAVLGRPQDTPDILATITCPVLVTHGKDDAVLLAPMAEYTAQAIKGATLSMYEGAGHTPFWEFPARFNRELAEFVNRTKA
jgi:pimeloyl-ACP methyl ester carboxylesterase